jgi:hypothetical protein
VIASHYAEPLKRTIIRATSLRAAPSAQSEGLCQLQPGDPFEMLDNSLGWAWGYGGSARRVGYVASEAVRTSPED